MKTAAVRVMRALVRGLKAFKTERRGFVSFAQKKFALTKDVAEIGAVEPILISQGGHGLLGLFYFSDDMFEQAGPNVQRRGTGERPQQRRTLL
ncbi:MAG: hypothetical protein HY695_27310 [Deltaproteobacteria bacterium]|nr:hypothetical protein [Deltaproteobacteria bacterium]